jgi:hypothetical protein
MQQITELSDAIDIYLDAIYFCDVAKLDAVFHQASSLFDADEGKIFVESIASFRKDVGSRPSPAGINQARRDEIIAIDWLSSLSAVVKLRLQAHENVFVDHLSFVKGSDGWKIVAKVWHLESKADIVCL